MSFTYSIQKFDFFSDQFEEMGTVDLAGALEAFQKFPFAEQLKQAGKSEVTTCLPKIIFKSSDTNSLSIWTADDKGFFLLYDNGKEIADFYLSNDIRKNPEGYSVEEFIELFFNENIEQSLNLFEKFGEDDEISETPAQHCGETVSFSFSNTNKLKPILWTIPLMAIALFMLYIDQKQKATFGLAIHILFGFLWVPTLLLHISFWFKNSNAKVIIDLKAKTIEYQRNGQTVKFNRSEIANCELNEAGSRAPWSAYRYLFIVLKDGREVVITNFITEPEIIIELLHLNFKIEKRIIPFLPL